MIKKQHIIILLIGLISLLSCQSSYYYEESKTITEEAWNENLPISFQFPIIDTLQNYNLYLDIDHTTDYEYQNLYVTINTKYPDAHSVLDTLSFDLANSIGEWNGKCQNEQCKLRVFMAHAIRFETPGTYTIKFTPYSRNKIVKHIQKLSFIIEKSSTIN